MVLRPALESEAVSEACSIHAAGTFSVVIFLFVQNDPVHHTTA